MAVKNIFQDVILPLISDDSSRAITWLQNKRLLAVNIKCDGCDGLMNWDKIFADEG